MKLPIKIAAGFGVVVVLGLGLVTAYHYSFNRTVEGFGVVLTVDAALADEAGGLEMAAWRLAAVAEDALRDPVQRERAMVSGADGPQPASGSGSRWALEAAALNDQAARFFDRAKALDRVALAFKCVDVSVLSAEYAKDLDQLAKRWRYRKDFRTVGDMPRLKKSWFAAAPKQSDVDPLNALDREIAELQMAIRAKGGRIEALAREVNAEAKLAVRTAAVEMMAAAKARNAVVTAMTMASAMVAAGMMLWVTLSVLATVRRIGQVAGDELVQELSAMDHAWHKIAECSESPKEDASTPKTADVADDANVTDP